MGWLPVIAIDNLLTSKQPAPTNRAFYERHSFRVLGEIRSGDSPPLFPMLREPR
jgi:hypothetical protein